MKIGVDGLYMSDLKTIKFQSCHGSAAMWEKNKACSAAYNF